MGSRYSSLFKESTIPGLSTIFASKPRTSKLLLLNVLIILVILTFKDLYSIASDYFTYPITVSVLVTESRVLPFPAVTVCNLNPIHRGRFCSSSDIAKPENIDKIICTDLTDLFQVCKITESLRDLVDDGRAICEGSGSASGSRRRRRPRNRKFSSPRARAPAGNVTTDGTRNANMTAGRRGDRGRSRRINNRPSTTEAPVTGEKKRSVSLETAVTVPTGGMSDQLSVPATSVPVTRRERDSKRGKATNTAGPHQSGQARSRQIISVAQSDLIRQIVKREVDDSDDCEGETGKEDDDEEEEEEQQMRENDNDEVNEDERQIINADRQIHLRLPLHSSCPLKRVKRAEPQFNLRTLFATFKSVQRGNFTGGLLEPFMESGGLFDTIILQVASLYGINVNSTRELLPALFMRAFTDVTGCSVGSSRMSKNGTNDEEPRVNPVNEALDNLTTIFQKSGCIWKAPRLLKLFQSTSQTLIKQLTSCTGPWVNDLLGYNASTAVDGETPWFILLDLLETWMSNLSRTDPTKAMKIGHQSTDLVKSCYFAGKKCFVEETFRGTFYPQHGNCFTYGMESGEAEREAFSGFTGPKFGLELMFELEKDQYMPTSREAGVKIVVHDRGAKADPDQDAINIAPGVVTYVGIQMLNITRMPAPYPDECTDEWKNEEYKRWAVALSHETYTIQVCLKICLQMHTMKTCKCWTPTAVWPPSTQNQLPECRSRQDEQCVDVVRHQYYDQKIQCSCTPRCTDRIYERSLSTGQETRQCSAIQSDRSVEQESNNDDASGEAKSSADDKENTAKVIVYFHSLSFNQIKQAKKYTIEGLLGAIGGILGVYLGASFFAMFELGEVVVRGLSKSNGNGTSRTSPQDPYRRRRRDGPRERRNRQPDPAERPDR